MDQFNFFDDYAQTTQDTNPATPTATKAAPAPASVDCGASNILVFAHQYQRQMWTAFKHRRDCMMQVGKFAAYKDFGIKPMSSITAVDCIEYRDYLQSTGMKKGTVNRHLSAVSACFRFAVETLQVMTDRPRVPLLKEDKPNTRAFTKEQVRQLVDFFNGNGDEWMADMVTLGCLTGMRRLEITSLCLSIIEWHVDTREIYLPAEVTKTNTGRMVSLAATGAWDVALRLRDTIGREFTHRRFYDRWNDAKHYLGHGDDDWFKFHATRHFAATNMAKAQMNALTVAEQLGHSSTATTKKYYHGDATARANAVSALSI